MRANGEVLFFQVFLISGIKKAGGPFLPGCGLIPFLAFSSFCFFTRAAKALFGS
jgi:hypothetical protein